MFLLQTFAVWRVAEDLWVVCKDSRSLMRHCCAVWHPDGYTFAASKSWVWK